MLALSECSITSTVLDVVRNTALGCYMRGFFIFACITVFLQRPSLDPGIFLRLGNQVKHWQLLLYSIHTCGQKRALVIQPNQAALCGLWIACDFATPWIWSLSSAMLPPKTACTICRFPYYRSNISNLHDQKSHRKRHFYRGRFWLRDSSSGFPRVRLLRGAIAAIRFVCYCDSAFEVGGTIRIWNRTRTF